MHKVQLITRYNLYESKRHFTAKFAEAFRRKGLEVVLDDCEGGTFPLWKSLRGTPPDFLASFNRFSNFADGKYIWEMSQIPAVSFLVDPVFYDQATLSPLSIATCVDRWEVAQYGKENLFFMPHAVERELSFDPMQPRPYDVVLIGSCYDPDHLKQFWRSLKAPLFAEMIEEGIALCLADSTINFLEAAQRVVDSRKLSITQIPFPKLVYYIDNYVRGIDRLELIRSLDGVQVHVFGGTCWRQERPLKGWSHYLATLPNVVLHPAIDFYESLEILKQSKIVLNSSPFFRDGTHERIFTALACGAFPITSYSRYIDEQFVEGEDLIQYTFNEREKVKSAVQGLLANETKRRAGVESGRQKVLTYHTWDQRVDELMQKLPPLLKKRQELFNS
jgi:glycosyltransferase involved in cell wall biosynthesis